MKLKTNCYKCKHRGTVPGSCHSSCTKPDKEMTGGKHGKVNGWFNYPNNFDPVWRTKECDNFEANPIQKHLGDGLYVSYDGFQIAISVNDHRNPPVAFLDPDVMDAMVEFINEIKPKVQITK